MNIIERYIACIAHRSMYFLQDLVDLQSRNMTPDNHISLLTLLPYQKVNPLLKAKWFTSLSSPNKTQLTPGCMLIINVSKLAKQTQNNM